ncbi:MAG: CTP synthase [Candidatus Marinimicrobia bacterium]|nr:CTP synthase [Candidatus Neomarinimicrobiota bacterium]
MVNKKEVKYIFIFGGVLSGLGKGIVSASLGYLLKSRGFNVTIQKLDPYLNIDPGTMNPYQHGEVFVLDDGSETDLDLGHYERFIDTNLSKSNTTSAGRVYWDVLKRERKGDYLGETIQVIPHITDEIKNRILEVNKNAEFDVIITEVGGTVGDIEGQPFYEAIRQLRLKIGRKNTMVIHLTLLPYLSASGEIKTKPTQHSVMRLREIGLDPEMIICRTENNHHLTQEMKNKISLFCNVNPDYVFESPDVESIYEIPLVLNKQGFDDAVVSELEMRKTSNHTGVQYLEQFMSDFQNPKNNITIAICGKYNDLHDAYKSILEAFIHSGVENKARINVKWVDTEKLEVNGNVENSFSNIDGILIPGGFGDRGIEGKILSVKYAREHHIPFFGICLGLQCAIIEFARNICNLQNANSTEFDVNTPFPVIDIMETQKGIKHKGASMRLGSYACELKQKTNATNAYELKSINERHRHRFELNNKFRDQLEEAGIIFSGINKKLDLVEIIEIKDHPWFVGVQFHPELKSRVVKAHPLFRDFISASVKYSNGKSK